MKNYVMFVCETCGYESKDFRHMQEHEDSHLELTAEESAEYQSLKANIEVTNRMSILRHNNETRSKYNKAIEDLIAFERQHGIGGR